VFNPLRVKSRRLELSLSVDQVAYRVGVNAATVYRWEAGDQVPRTNEYVRLAEALRVPFSALLAEAADSEDPDEFPAVVGAVLTRRKDPHHKPMSTYEDAEAALIVDGINDVRRESGRG
jgi:transcriptional regulator with XRE-family HTH domain